MSYPINALFYAPPRPEYMPCSVEQSARLNLITLMDRSTTEEWARHDKYIKANIKGDFAAILAYCCQELTSLDAADDAQMYRELSEGRY